MRKAPQAWTRREFVRGAAGVMALGRVPGGTSQLQFAYVASGKRSIEVFSVTEKRWTLVQRIQACAPARLLLSADQRTLYATSEVDVFGELPRGAVEIFHVHADGRLTGLCHAALSLSATRPRHMALSPDGKLLAVAAYGGGIYNLLPVAADGSLGPPSGIFKDAGCGPHPPQGSSHPHTLCFDERGRHLLATDFGSDRLSTFSVEHGNLTRQSQRSSSGPGACALHPKGSMLYVQHELDNTLACYGFDAASGTVANLLNCLTFQSLRTFALGRSGRRLYTVHQEPNELRVWHVGASGTLAPERVLRIGNANHIALHNETVYLLNGRQESIDKVDARSTNRATVALVDEPKSIVFKNLP